MNLYIRYFDNEAFVSSADDAIAFLRGIPEVGLDRVIEDDIREYCKSDILFPKRYKVRPRVYFIIIKTTANSMMEFKQKKAVRPYPANGERSSEGRETVAATFSRLTEQRAGWYEGELNFKRVVPIPSTGKFEYCDTKFVARCKAESGMDCYNKLVSHLQERVDRRSQFPSAKGRNFHFKYLGMWK